MQIPSSPFLKVIRYQTFACWPEPARETPTVLVDPAARFCPVFRQASGLGWYLFPPFDAEFRWRGSREFEVRTDDALGEKLWPEVMRELHGWPSPWWCSKIPGVLQIDPGLVLVTPPGVKILLTAPLNQPNTGYWTQSGVLDSDWFRVGSTINLQMRCRNRVFLLRRTEPIAQLVLLARDLATEHRFETAEVMEDPGVQSQWIDYLHRVYGPQPDSDSGGRLKRNVYRRLKKKVEAGLYTVPRSPGETAE